MLSLNIVFLRARYRFTTWTFKPFSMSLYILREIMPCFAKAYRYLVYTSAANIICLRGVTYKSPYQIWQFLVFSKFTAYFSRHSEYNASPTHPTPAIDSIWAWQNLLPVDSRVKA